MIFCNDKEIVWRDVSVLTVLVVVGFIFRILLAELMLGGLSRSYEGDESSYVNLAIHVTKGLGFTDNSGTPTSYRAPGLPLLLTIPISLIGPSIVGIRIFMCFVESLLIPAFYLLTRSVTGSVKLGFIAGVVAIFFPSWLVPSGAVLTDVPAAIFVTLMAWMLTKGYQQQSLFWIVGAGFTWGAATLVRAVSLVYAPAIIFWLLLIMRGWKMRLASVVAVTVPFACLLAPWSLRNTYVHDEFVLISSQGGVQLYISNNPKSTGILAIDQAYVDETRAQRYPKERYPSEITRDNLFQAEAVNFIRENPLRFAELCLIRLGQFWKLYSPRVSFQESLGIIASFGVALPFFLLQVIRRGWRRGPEMLFLSIILCHMGLHMVYGSIVRYRIPIEPLVIVMAISGLCWIWGRFRCRYRNVPSPLNCNTTVG